jgi:ornithine carbamoyltransferase
MPKRDFLRITDINRSEFEEIISISEKLKAEIKSGKKNEPIFLQKTLVAIYEKPSLRTRISFEIGMTQLGGHAVYLGPDDIQMGKRESASDIGTVTGSMADMIMARTFKHESVEELAKGSAVPVINGLSNLEHPCQIMADFLTIKETLGTMSGLKITFIGDGNNNVTHSLALASAMLGSDFYCASPKGYEMDDKILKEALSFGTKVVQTEDIKEASKNADVIVADTWVSMGSEAEAGQRLQTFSPYQVTQDVMNMANPEAIFMHCLPAYRGKEVSAEVIDGPQSVIFPEAENRLHAQKGLMVWLAMQSYGETGNRK